MQATGVVIKTKFLTIPRQMYQGSFEDMQNNKPGRKHSLFQVHQVLVKSRFAKDLARKLTSLTASINSIAPAPTAKMERHMISDSEYKAQKM